MIQQNIFHLKHCGKQFYKLAKLNETQKYKNLDVEYSILIIPIFHTTRLIEKIVTNLSTIVTYTNIDYIIQNNMENWKWNMKRYMNLATTFCQ